MKTFLIAAIAALALAFNGGIVAQAAELDPVGPRYSKAQRGPSIAEARGCQVWVCGRRGCGWRDGCDDRLNRSDSRGLGRGERCAALLPRGAGRFR